MNQDSPLRIVSDLAPGISASEAVRRAKKAAYRAAHPRVLTEEQRARAKVRSSERYLATRDHRRAVSKKWYGANAERIRLRSPSRIRMRKYGLTPEAFAVLLEVQSGSCAICRAELLKGRGTHVDHDHVTGRVRGLLCNPCNLGLGVFRDSREYLAAAIDYLGPKGTSL